MDVTVTYMLTAVNRVCRWVGEKLCLCMGF